MRQCASSSVQASPRGASMPAQAMRTSILPNSLLAVLAMVKRLRTRGAQLVGEVVQYKDAYRLCYIRGPEGLLIGLAQELS